MGERGEVKERENRKIQVSCARGGGRGVGRVPCKTFCHKGDRL